MIDRRNALKLALCSAAVLAAPHVRAQTDKARTRIVFLGTKGGPRAALRTPPISSSSTTPRS
ncbi:hypothetical protein RX327_00695 [Bradyrhizobium sp. BEA-2-5]|uniref:hypothetical protein n=1 Tax=Bradyrhizobium sp. BEA-2-5 TaxID=3080015 RepID=UPI00293EFAFF|nr:hypothetical protein [Bradyrhizobium sp. BEA-2-5]WOH81780.1 hypothetical protein RX327_00695 [Bradyrhizobium sp. BEA-2-5]